MSAMPTSAQRRAAYLRAMISESEYLVAQVKERGKVALKAERQRRVDALTEAEAEALCGRDPITASSAKGRIDAWSNILGQPPRSGKRIRV